MDFETLALHGRLPNPLLDGAVIEPIHLTTTFPRATDGGYPDGYSYTRQANPNRIALEQTLAALEGAAAASCFASGTAAAMAVFQSLATGDHVIVPRDFYYGNRVMLQEIFPRWGLGVSFVDMADPKAVRAALTPRTRLVWIETPANPLMTVTDIAAMAELAHRHGAVLALDNTVPTCLLQRGFEHGADLVVYSTTKYINGHSDVLGGAVVSKKDDDFHARIRSIQVHGGAVPSPFDCWLTLRGVRTLAFRVRRQSESALAIATWLRSHPRVERVYYAGLPSHPGHELAARQMHGGFGGLLAFDVKGGEKAAFGVVAACRLIGRATSLGGVESLIEHRASMEGPGTTVPGSLLRLSVGLESASDLIEDLKQALD